MNALISQPGRKARRQPETRVELLLSFDEYVLNGHDLSTENIQTLCHEDGHAYAVLMSKVTNIAPGTFGWRLQTKRLAMNNMSGEKLGKGMGADGRDLERSTVSSWEHNRTSPSCRQLLLICERLGVTPQYMLFGNEGFSPEVQELAAILEALPPGDIRNLAFENVRALKKYLPSELQENAREQA